MDIIGSSKASRAIGAMKPVKLTRDNSRSKRGTHVIKLS
jgi:hypothetical protein